MTQDNTTPANAFEQLFSTANLEPGAEASYEQCKLLYAYHPLGKKMVDFPVEMALYKPRHLKFKGQVCEDELRERYNETWTRCGMDSVVKSLAGQARMYGVTAAVWGVVDSSGNAVLPDAYIDLNTIADKELYFNVLDPLVTAGSMVTDQDPNSPHFLKTGNVTAGGVAYAKSRSFVLMNERPLFIKYTSSSYGYVGRSVYQRALFPLMTFVQSMITDDLVTRKAGVLVLKMEQAGSIVDNILSAVNRFKRAVFKQATTGNVINIGQNDSAETLNLQNTADAMTTARKNVIENIASAADMPAIILNSETFAEGFADGTEDAKTVQRFIDGIRRWLDAVFEWLDNIMIYVAFDVSYFQTLQARYSTLKNVKYAVWFNEVKNAFKYEWPKLLEEPDSELAKQDKVKVEGVAQVMEVLLPHLDPENKAALIEWAQKNINEFSRLFPETMELDTLALASYVPPMPTMGEQNGEE